MINKRQENILRQGGNVWNAWRRRYPHTPIELRGIELQGVDLQGVDLNYVDFRDTTLVNVDLSHANLWQTNFSGADLRKSRFKRADVRGANFTAANLSEANFSDGMLGGTQFTNANLSHANFGRANFGDGTYFQFANLSYASLLDTDVGPNDLSHARLDHAVLSGSDLIDTNLSGASLKHAFLSGARLEGTLLDAANLSGAHLDRANFFHAHLNKTNFTQASIGWTLFNDVDLRGIDGLETVEHIGPSEISISTLYRSVRALPALFLRRAGISSSLLQRIPDVFSHQKENIRCFLCYTYPNQVFAQQLYEDLIAKNVCCWLAPIDLWYVIESDPSVYDKLIFILPQVQEEENGRLTFTVREALQKEQREMQRCFTLVSVDNDAVNTDLLQMLAEHDHAARSIISFAPWQSSGTYMHALQALLRDLAWTSEVQDC